MAIIGQRNELKRLGLVVIASLLASHAAEIPLPPPVPDRIGRAQIFSYRIKDRQALVGKRDLVWGDAGQKVSGVYSIKYMPTDRDPEKKHDIAWYKTNHPDWIAYQGDRESPAHEFKYAWGYNTPVDFNNPAVREYLFAVNVKPDVATRRYEGIGVDNVECRNEWHRAGVWGADGWHQLYAGGKQKVDPAFARDVAAWMGWLGARVHAAGMALVANHYPHLDDEAGYRLVATKLDIILDEHGYTRDGKAMLTDAKWLSYISLFAELARTKPIVVIDQLAKEPAGITPTVRNWSLANYLLMKGDRTYLAWPLENTYGQLDEYPDLYLQVGRPLEPFVQDGLVYRRRFEHALALVNSQNKSGATCDIGPGRWRDLGGAQYSGVVSLPPASGLVLVPEAQPK